MTLRGTTPTYLANFPAFSEQASFEAMYKMIPRLHSQDVTLVDAMAGIGLVGKNISRRIHERRRKYVSVVYLDISEEMLAHQSYQSNDRRIHTDIQNIDLHEESADIVTCRCGLNNLEEDEWEAAISEMMRITKNRGILLLQDHFPLTEQQRTEMDAIEQCIARIDGRSNDPSLKTLDEVQQLISENGGELLDTQTISYPFDLRKRLEAKGIGPECIREGKIVYPISTLAARKL